MKTKSFLIVLLCLGLNASAINGKPFLKGQMTPDVIAFVGVNVVTGHRDQVLEKQTVIVRGEKIIGMGAAAETKVPKSAVRIDGRGKYLMPGLVDMHAHLNSPKELPLYLANGVTTVYNLNGRPAHLKWRESINRGSMIGPTIYTCGPTIRVLGKAEDARRIIEEQHKAGYDSIKIYNWVSKEAYEVLIDEAKKRGMLYVGHISRDPGFDGTLKAGQAVAHAEEFMYTFFDNKVDDDSRIPQAVQKTREAGVPVIATLVAFDHIIRQAENLPALLARPEMSYLAPWVRSEWGPEKNLYKKKFANPESIAYLNKSLALQKKLLKALHQAGVKILTGTDAMNMGVVPGFSLHEELRNLVEIGFTPFEAIQGATRYPAEFLSGTRDFGTVAAGKRADLILVSGNPLQDITQVSNPVGVMTRGRWLPSAELRRMLDRVAADYTKEDKFVREGFARNSKDVIQYLDDNDPFANLLTSVVDTVADAVIAEGAGNFRGMHIVAKESHRLAPLINGRFIYLLGQQLLGRGKTADAIEVFKLNVETYPNAASVHHELAEAYVVNKQRELAIKSCKRALELDPKYESAIELLNKLETKPEDKQ